jgi:hypothetical protein
MTVYGNSPHWCDEYYRSQAHCTLEHSLAEIVSAARFKLVWCSVNWLCGTKIFASVIVELKKCHPHH